MEEKEAKNVLSVEKDYSMVWERGEDLAWGVQVLGAHLV